MNDTKQIKLYAKLRVKDAPFMKIETRRLCMEDKHIEKLTEEYNNLEMKICKLKRFMKSKKFALLDDHDQQLLSLQKTQMKALQKTLDMRLNWEHC